MSYMPHSPMILFRGPPHQVPRVRSFDGESRPSLAGEILPLACASVEANLRYLGDERILGRVRALVKVTRVNMENRREKVRLCFAIQWWTRSRATRSNSESGHKAG